MSDSDRQDADRSEIRPVTNRRDFIKGGVAGAASISFASLLARRAGAAELPYSDEYGPVAPVNDLTTGLPLIALPAGFSYRTYGWTGQLMSDGQRTPSLHDGMAVVAAKGNQIVMVRNHEQGTSGGIAFTAPAAFEPSFGRGGTTNVLFDYVTGRFQGSFPSLTGTIRNCAGGRTPWGSWLTCEENTSTSPAPASVRHGWIFEVPGYGVATGQPLTAMGRSEWEACAVDPATGYVYQTEDLTPGGFYKFIPNQYGKLALGGTLWALKVVGQDNYNFSGLSNVYVDHAVGTTWNVEWVQVADVAPATGRLYNTAPGRAAFARPEGAWYDSGKIYFTCTSGGVLRRGQVFVYDPRRETLTIIFNSLGTGAGNTACDMPDNIAVSPRGGVILCEDGGSSIQKMRGLTQAGGTFIFAENRIDLTTPGYIAQIDSALNAGGSVAQQLQAISYTNQEWAGACFYEKWMFVNIQTPGITLAITGPWDNGAL